MRVIICLAATAMAVPSASSALATSPATVVDQSKVEAAMEHVAEIDEDRLFSDRAYAAATAEHLEVLRRSSKYEGEAKLGIDLLRTSTMLALGRGREALEIASALNREFPDDPTAHGMAVVAAINVDANRALAEIEHADRVLAKPASRAEFVGFLDREIVQYIGSAFRAPVDEARLGRLAEALLNLGYPDKQRLVEADNLRLDAVKARISRNDLAGARALSSRITTPSELLPLLIDHRFDALVGEADRLAMLDRAIESHDRLTREALARHPKDADIILNRAQFLRAVGREQEAADLLLPTVGDMTAVERGGEPHFWLANEAGYSLLALGRENEATALMRKLIALGLEKHPTLISMAINLGPIMRATGQYRASADYAAQLFADHGDLASLYGQMWMWASAACGYALSGDKAAAEPWIERARKDGETTNPAALTEALLCAGRDDEAAALVIRRLAGPGRSDMLSALQDYNAGPQLSAARGELARRLQALRQRPDVAAAIRGRGRILKLPLSRIYWGLS